MGNATSVSPMVESNSVSDNVPWVMVSYDPGPYYKGFRYYSYLQVYSNRPDLVCTLKVPPCQPTGDVHSNILNNEQLQTALREVRIKKNTTVEDLVHCLLGMYKDLHNGEISEADKVNILYSWLTVQNIDCADYALTHDFLTVIFHLQKLRDGKNSYAAFFSLLCYYAGIPCVIVKGHVKNGGYDYFKRFFSDKYIREWNAVFVDNQWRLVDSYWGRMYRYGIMTPEYFYLFTNPQHAKYSHFPENPKWQLLETPVTRNQFLKQPILTSRFFQMKLELVNQRSGKITCTSKEVELIFHARLHLTRNSSFICAVSIRNETDRKWVFLKQLSHNAKIWFGSRSTESTVSSVLDVSSLRTFDPSCDSKNTEQNIVQELPQNLSQNSGQELNANIDPIVTDTARDDNDLIEILSVNVKFHQAGNYKIEIIGTSESFVEYDRIAVYNIKVKSQAENLVLERVCTAGPNANLSKCGLEAVTHTEGYITSEEEQNIKFQFRIHPQAFTRNIKMTYKLTSITNATETSESPLEHGTKLCSKRIEPDLDDTLKFTVHLDAIGRFKLDIEVMLDNVNIGTVMFYRIDTVEGLHCAAVKKLQKAIDRGIKEEIEEAIKNAESVKSHKDVRKLFDKAFAMFYRLKRNEEAVNRIQSLTRHHVGRIRSYTNPNPVIVNTIRAVLILLGKQKETLKTWAGIKVHLKDDIIKQIQKFEPDAVDIGVIRNAQAELGDEDSYSSVHQAEDVAALVKWMETVFDQPKLRAIQREQCD